MERGDGRVLACAAGTHGLGERRRVLSQRQTAGNALTRRNCAYLDTGLIAHTMYLKAAVFLAIEKL